jgi:AAA15 family ATPase/GTPase
VHDNATLWLPFMINSLNIQNFKGFEEIASANLSRITLLYGPNSAGKSSMIQSLMLLKQSFVQTVTPSPRFRITGDLVTQGDFVDLGTFKSLINVHNESKTLQYSVCIQSDHNRGIKKDIPVEISLSYHKEDLRSFGITVGPDSTVNLRFLKVSRRPKKVDLEIDNDILDDNASKYSIDGRSHKNLAK